MRFFTLVSLLLTFGLDASGKEFFVLQGIDKTHPDDVLQSPGLDGFTIRVSWKKLHDEGFAWLDEQIRRGDELDVNMQLHIMAGANAPADLPGVAYFDYLSTDSVAPWNCGGSPFPGTQPCTHIGKNWQPTWAADTATTRASKSSMCPASPTRRSSTCRRK